LRGAQWLARATAFGGGLSPSFLSVVGAKYIESEDLINPDVTLKYEERKAFFDLLPSSATSASIILSI
jgi:hypothetical protein